MVYDEINGEFRPRHGYKRVDKDGSQLPWVEVPANAGMSVACRGDDFCLAADNSNVVP
jgi:hypothetical protein